MSRNHVVANLMSGATRTKCNPKKRALADPRNRVHGHRAACDFHWQEGASGGPSSQRTRTSLLYSRTRLTPKAEKCPETGLRSAETNGQFPQECPGSASLLAKVA